MGWFKKQKPEGLYWVPDHYLEEYDIEDWDSIVSEFYSVEEWEDLMWEERMFIFECIRNGDIEIENGPIHKNTGNCLSFYLKIFSLLIPVQFREIIIGDLFECRSVMQKLGLSKFKINSVTAIKILIILMATIKIRLSDFLFKGRDIQKNQ